MSGHVSTTNGPSIPMDVMSNIEKTLSKSVLGKILEEYIMGEVKLTMWIPEELVGKVIGKKGLVVQNLQRETKTKSITALPRVGDSLWLAVVIFGEIKPVFNACKAVSDLVDGEVDDVVFEFIINYRKSFFLYGGKKFGVIKKISADTNVRIFYPEFDPKTQPYKDALPFTLEGSSQNVAKAIVLLEKEALIYEHQQAVRLEKSEGDNSVCSGDSFIRDAKAVHRTQQSQHKANKDSTPTTTTTTSIKNNGANKDDTRSNKTKSSNKLVDTAGIERILASGDARLTTARSRPVVVPSVTAVAAVPSSGSSSSGAVAVRNTTTTTTAGVIASSSVETNVVTIAEVNADNATAEDTSATTAPATTKIEKVVNIPTTLVGLLLSKRPKSTVTTINSIQVMTHTIISKLPPAGFVSSLPTTAVEMGKEGEKEGMQEEVVEGQGEGVSESNSEKVRRRRVGSDESAGKGEDDEEEDSDTGSEDEGSDESESEETESSSGSDATRDSGSNKDNEGEVKEGGDVKVETVERNSDKVIEEEKKEIPLIEGEEKKEDAPTATEAEAAVGGVEVVVVKTPEQLAREAEKKRMIEESERLGYVPFRVVGYHEDNVDAVITAIEEIIAGRRIGEVMEELKVKAKKLQWPPHRTTRRTTGSTTSRGRKPRDGSSNEYRIKKVRVSRGDRGTEREGTAAEGEGENKPFRPRSSRVSKPSKDRSERPEIGVRGKYSKREYSTTTGTTTSTTTVAGSSNREEKYNKTSRTKPYRSTEK